jgi:hypothetical protein
MGNNKKEEKESFNINYYGSGIPCHVVTCTSATTGGVERQNPSICTNRSFVNNLFFP